MYKKRSLESGETSVLYRGRRCLKAKPFSYRAYVNAEVPPKRRCESANQQNVKTHNTAV